MPTQVLAGQVATLFGKAPETVLVIGWATGVTVGSVARSPVQQIDAVELEPAIMEASHFFDHVNGRPLEDPRVRVILDDGRTHLSYGRDRYDVIISEPSNPWMTGVSDLFTAEFFQAAKAALRPGGRLLQWVPAYGIDSDAMNSILAALRGEFPYVYGFAIDRRVPDVLVVASLGGAHARFPAALRNSVRADPQRSRAGGRLLHRPAVEPAAPAARRCRPRSPAKVASVAEQRRQPPGRAAYALDHVLGAARGKHWAFTAAFEGGNPPASGELARGGGSRVRRRARHRLPAAQHVGSQRDPDAARSPGRPHDRGARVDGARSR